MFHLKPRRTWCWHVKVYFLGQALMPDHNTCTHSQNLTWNIYSVLAQWGKQDTVFTCPSAIIYRLYLPGAMSSPVWYTSLTFLGQPLFNKPYTGDQKLLNYFLMMTSESWGVIGKVGHGLMNISSNWFGQKDFKLVKLYLDKMTPICIVFL